MQEFKIRKAQAGDLDQLRAYEQDLIQTERPFDPTLKANTNYYDLQGMIDSPHVHLIVAELHDKLVGTGYARLEGAKPYLKHSTYAYLGFMYVVPEQRGKGINKIILEALKEWTRSQNVIELRLEVYFNNVPAIKAYEKFGFTKHIIEMRLSF